MKPWGRVLALPARLEWRRTDNLVRLGIFLAVLASAAAAFLLRDLVSPTQAGYGGIAILSLVASASFVIPVPALFAVCASSGPPLHLNPLLTGLIAGTSESVSARTGWRPTPRTIGSLRAAST